MSSMYSGMQDVQDYTNQSYKAVDSYMKQYDNYNKQVENEANKDDLNKLIVVLQKMNQQNEDSPPLTTVEKPLSARGLKHRSLNNLVDAEELKEEETKQQVPKPRRQIFQYSNFKETLKAYEEFEAKEIKQIDFVLLVGFHHIVGSQVEFIYPPAEENENENEQNTLTTDFL